MSNNVSILISSAGRRGQLIACFRDAAQVLGLRLRVLTADAKPELSAACCLADKNYAVPRCTDASFVPALCEICSRERTVLMIPTIDTELSVLSAHREMFTGLGVYAAISAPNVISLARDKLATARTLRMGGLNVPDTVSLQRFKADPRQIRGPVIAKPVGGSSSIGLLRPSGPEELLRLSNDDYIVQELWSGREYTVNMYFDRNGEIRCAIPHWRIETRGGEVSKGRTEDIPVLREAARKIARCLPGARGALCFQSFVADDGSYAVFEINARFGGGYPLAHHAGARFAQWLLEEALGVPCTANDNWRTGVTMLRYDAAVFMDGIELR